MVDTPWQWPRRILVYGDSNTWGLVTSPGTGSPERLSDAQRWPGGPYRCFAGQPTASQGFSPFWMPWSDTCRARRIGNRPRGSDPGENRRFAGRMIGNPWRR